MKNPTTSVLLWPALAVGLMLHCCALYASRLEDPEKTAKIVYMSEFLEEMEEKTREMGSQPGMIGTHASTGKRWFIKQSGSVLRAGGRDKPDVFPIYMASRLVNRLAKALEEAFPQDGPFTDQLNVMYLVGDRKGWVASAELDHFYREDAPGVHCALQPWTCTEEAIRAFCADRRIIDTAWIYALEVFVGNMDRNWKNYGVRVYDDYVIAVGLDLDNALFLPHPDSGEIPYFMYWLIKEKGASPSREYQERAKKYLNTLAYVDFSIIEHTIRQAYEEIVFAGYGEEYSPSTRDELIEMLELRQKALRSLEVNEKFIRAARKDDVKALRALEKQYGHVDGWDLEQRHPISATFQNGKSKMNETTIAAPNALKWLIRHGYAQHFQECEVSNCVPLIKTLLLNGHVDWANLLLDAGADLTSTCQYRRKAIKRYAKMTLLEAAKEGNITDSTLLERLALLQNS